MAQSVRQGPARSWSVLPLAGETLVPAARNPPPGGDFDGALRDPFIAPHATEPGVRFQPSLRLSVAPLGLVLGAPTPIPRRLFSCRCPLDGAGNRDGGAFRLGVRFLEEGVHACSSRADASVYASAPQVTAQDEDEVSWQVSAETRATPEIVRSGRLPVQCGRCPRRT
jgi:hypothetical protein